MSDIWEPAGGHVAWEGSERERRRRRAEKEGYDAVIRPWSGGWEIFHIKGPGIDDGATQACLIDEIEDMIRDYVDCAFDLSADDNPDDEWDVGAVPVRLVLNLEPHRHMGTRANVLPMGSKGVLVEEVTWWVEGPEAE